MSPHSPETTPPRDGDYSFIMPSEDKLLFFLRQKIACEPLPTAAAPHFHYTDIYATDPALLTTLFDPAPAPTKKGESGSWFFFTRVRPKSSSDSRKSRQVAGGVGTWHSERAPRRVLDDEGNCAGHSQYFNYKLKTGKRTEWYMVEITHDQEAAAVEPLVLCRIYKAHTRSGSGSGSVSRPSARKRKDVDDDEASVPVKAKRRLFDSPAPASVVSLQEQVSSKGWIAGEAATLQGKLGLGDTYGAAFMSKADGGAATSQGKVGDTLDWIASMSKADGIASMSKADGIASMSKADGEAAMSQGNMSAISDWFPFMSKSDGEVATSSDCIASMSKACSEPATSQLKIGDTSDFYRFWPEPEATFEFDGGCSMTGGALPTLENCRDVGDLFCSRNTWSSAFGTSYDTMASVWSMPSAPVRPPGEACWWSGTGGYDVWSF